MDLYLNKKLQSIPIFRIMLTLLEKFNMTDLMKSNLIEIDDADLTRHIWDPVQDFLDYYIQSSNIPMDEGRKQYIINSLYAAKGSKLVFDIFEEVFDVRLDYDYPFPKIELLEFDPLKINNVEIFVNKLSTMLYYLIYYSELTIHIKNLTLSLQGELVQYTGGLVLGYQYHNITNIQELS